MKNVYVAYSESPHDEIIPVYANKKLEVLGKDGQPRKVVVTVQNYCQEYIEAYVNCECNFLSKEKLGSEPRAKLEERVDALVEFSLWQLERKGIEATPELEEELRSTILEGIRNFETKEQRPGAVKKTLSYLKKIIF